MGLYIGIAVHAYVTVTTGCCIKEYRYCTLRLTATFNKFQWDWDLIPLWVLPRWLCTVVFLRNFSCNEQRQHIILFIVCWDILARCSIRKWQITLKSTNISNSNIHNYELVCYWKCENSKSYPSHLDYDGWAFLLLTKILHYFRHINFFPLNILNHVFLFEFTIKFMY